MSSPRAVDAAYEQLMLVERSPLECPAAEDELTAALLCAAPQLQAAACAQALSLDAAAGERSGVLASTVFHLQQLQRMRRVFRRSWPQLAAATRFLHAMVRERRMWSDDVSSCASSNMLCVEFALKHAPVPRYPMQERGAASEQSPVVSDALSELMTSAPLGVPSQRLAALLGAASNLSDAHGAGYNGSSSTEASAGPLAPNAATALLQLQASLLVTALRLGSAGMYACRASRRAAVRAYDPAFLLHPRPFPTFQGSAIAPMPPGPQLRHTLQRFWHMLRRKRPRAHAQSTAGRARMPTDCFGLQPRSRCRWHLRGCCCCRPSTSRVSLRCCA